MITIPRSRVRWSDDFRFTIVMAFGVLAVLPPAIAEEAGTSAATPQLRGALIQPADATAARLDGA